MEGFESLIEALKTLIELDDSMLNEQVLDTISNSIDEQFSSALSEQSINQTIKGFEEQGLTKEEARQSMNALMAFLREKGYGDKQLTGYKKQLVELVYGKLEDICDKAVEKYHSYAIELPMVIDTEANAIVPLYVHETDAAADLYALETVTLAPHSYGNKIRTGVKIQLPEGWLAFILPRSSIGAKTPLRLSNSIGLIDSGYRGELGILYDNISDEPYTINTHDRIAQLLVMPSYRFKPQVVKALTDSDRGETGFGDSGK